MYIFNDLNKYVNTQNILVPNPEDMYKSLHRDDVSFPFKILPNEKLKGYNWYIPKFIIPHIFFENGLIELKINDYNDDGGKDWVSAKVIREVFNIDIKYFKYKHYDIIFLGENKTTNFLNSFILSISLILGLKHRINIVISEDSSKCGFENKFPLKFCF
jgi:hypothetical protein